MQTPLPVQTPLPGTAPTPLLGTMENLYNMPTGGTPITPSDYSSINENGASDRVGRPSAYMASAFLSSSSLWEPKQPVEPDEVVEKENAKENGKENAKKGGESVENKKERGKEKENEKKDDERVENKTERGKEKENEKELLQRRMTRAQRKTWIRIENNVLLRMTAMMVDGQVSKVDFIKVQCEDSLYGYESYTYLTWDDFQVVFTLEELTGSVITSYTMAIVLSCLVL
ncbi:hypothetical protein L1987_54303 [Smallanthus sonchifolius]|uniref:Uncharacterized protein n=1 Tax=Smallanthus sonchifolius TaxID=185202 RepID=A0ACB9E7E6_9ASTR|nr:hypothetical protein L1987_54303 [Smallanthus sonchifolius]